jgi:predicted metal-dependent hydrolase
VRALIDAGTLAQTVARRHPKRTRCAPSVRCTTTWRALKARHMRSAGPLAKVAYDNQLHVLQNALGTHSAVSRVQGKQLKAKREIRIAALFKDAPADFLRMIVVHELAHLKEREHDKAFYALCSTWSPTTTSWSSTCGCG